MFIIRGKNKEIVTNTEIGSENGKELKFDTYEQAAEMLKTLETSLPKDMFKIVPLDCDRCGGHNDVTIIHVNDEPKAFCHNCRVELFAKKKPVGRPSVGVTKKVSLTLTEEYWEWLDDKSEGNRSKFLREVVTNALGSESEWSNYACLGYAITAAENLGYDFEQTLELVRAIQGAFDFKTVDEARDIYTNSDY